MRNESMAECYDEAASHLRNAADNLGGLASTLCLGPMGKTWRIRKEAASRLRREAITNIDAALECLRRAAD